MKKLGYEIETKHYTSIIIGIIFPILILLGGLLWWNDILTVILCISIIVFIIIMVATLLQYNKDKKRCNIYTKIKQNGIRVNGKILNYKRYMEYLNGNDIIFHYTLLIEFINPNNNETKRIETPYLNFVPLKALGSKDCSVYIYNEDVYITDFVNIRDGEKIELDEIR